MNDTSTASPVYVFVHGFLGFDEIRFPGITIPYVRGLSTLMKMQKRSYFIPRLSRGGSIKKRSQALADFLEEIDAPAYVLIGYSMGGLDARYVASHLDSGKRIRSVITVGTPHRGSWLADWAMTSRGPLAWLARRICKPALQDMTIESCARFNETTPDREDVIYLSLAASRPINELPFWIRNLAAKLDRHAGENDGQVPVTSAKWGRFLDVVYADHWELIGWSFAPRNASRKRPFDHLAMYAMALDTLDKMSDRA